jgi:hypothetical protein
MSDDVTKADAVATKRAKMDGFITIDGGRSFTSTTVNRNPAARPSLPAAASNIRSKHLRGIEDKLWERLYAAIPTNHRGAKPLLQQTKPKGSLSS